ncbi:CheR family methyltransferase [Anaerobranca gottschalkii]|uniref:protein-glutamate O-methyltransferase n=1 Tax=Anaerobranca gottschalkii DSM 13577 TaxID=1120990 RepID=A0A1H9ZJM1_9FIRM|nr:protein-glutamate O-methyltransferase CheR [Anaerobranca gottschalkii]SES81906.1 chemotaxis protein methyltransferase CheR [Anaerobranca gottschalkii DSM 13577]
MLLEREYVQFLEKIYKKTGLNLNLYKEKQMKRRIDTLVQKYNKNTYEDYYNLILGNRELFDEFMDKVTINVSEFFRNLERWEVLKKEIIPILRQYNKGKLKVWSAACSTGQEPYSLTMLLTNLEIPHEILATDLDKKVLSKAKEGKYDIKEISGIPEIYHQYLVKEKDQFRINPSLKTNITFKEHNLLTNDYPKGFDLILCRNVMIYFKEEIKKEIYSQFNQSLNRGGVLFVGSTEQIFFPQKLGFKSIQTFFYQKIE